MLPRTQKGIIQLGIIGLVVLTAGLFAVSKLASNKDLTFFNIAEQAKALSGADACKAKGCPWAWKNGGCKKTEDTKCDNKSTTKSVAKPESRFDISVSGQKSSYKPGEKINLSVKITEKFDGSEGTAAEDFNVQGTIDSTKDQGGRVANANGQYSKTGWIVNFNAPSKVRADYYIWISAYCLTEKGVCAQRYYGTGAYPLPQATWKYTFTISP